MICVYFRIRVLKYNNIAFQIVHVHIHITNKSTINFITVITTITGMTCSTDLQCLTHNLYHLNERLTDITVLIACLDVWGYLFLEISQN